MRAASVFYMLSTGEPRMTEKATQPGLAGGCNCGQIRYVVMPSLFVVGSKLHLNQGHCLQYFGVRFALFRAPKYAFCHRLHAVSLFGQEAPAPRHRLPKDDAEFLCRFQPPQRIDLVRPLQFLGPPHHMRVDQLSGEGKASVG